MMMGIVMIGAARSRKEKGRRRRGWVIRAGRRSLRCAMFRISGEGVSRSRRRKKKMEMFGDDGRGQKGVLFFFFLRMLSLDGGDVLYDGVGSCGG
jgi:hypothetical protein